ncbi:hypothetical protein [Candidatus Similichlamydia epinepheli]|uniref:hypothetical protein n=1 Tax=Candidatus Similichlamydia epinepheli TaxID=1903953 RepID=UPI000D3AF86B|nr:hypothetical protein [Candidatus Similichlamydia epinepheli]
MSTSCEHGDCDLRVVQVILQSIRSSLSSESLSNARKLRKCTQLCGELLDFHPVHTFEEFHSFVLAIGYKNQSEKNILEKASSDAWFNPPKLKRKSLVPAELLLPKKVSRKKKIARALIKKPSKQLPARKKKSNRKPCI